MTAIPTSKRWKILRMAMSTLIAGKPRGLFIPMRAAGALRRPASYPVAAAAFDQCANDFRAVLRDIDGFRDDLLAIRTTATAPAPRWGQGWFPALDAAVAYTMVRRHQPRRIVEIGSGHSTRFLAQAVADGQLDTEILCIDPAPRAPLPPVVTHRAAPLQSTELDWVDDLNTGDVLFIDSSHVAMPATDVDLLFAEILPRLPAGTLVHIHDIFLPDDYPADWHWRGYNESLPAAMLVGLGGFRPLFASHYAATRLAPALAASVIADLPRPIQAPDTSLWLEKGTFAVRR